jgi:circadian clock protein KaiB
MKKYLMKLFVAGDSPRSERAIQNLVELCNRTMKNNYEITIIDVLEQPAIAEEDKIMATPTLIKLTPYPSRRIVGDLSDQAKVLTILGVQ